MSMCQSHSIRLNDPALYRFSGDPTLAVCESARWLRGLVSVVLLGGIAQWAMFWSRYDHVPSFPAPTSELPWEAGETHARLLLGDSTVMEFVRLGSGAEGTTLWMAAYEVTVGQYRRFVSATRYQTVAEREGYGWLPADTGFVRSAGASWSEERDSSNQHTAVGMVAWIDAAAFAKWLSVATGHSVRLPSEAEWRTACLAGGYPSSADSLASMQWSRLNASRTQVVGTRSPDANGVYDLLGNVWEWNAGPKSGLARFTDLRYRSLRGGSWRNPPTAFTCMDSTTNEDVRIREPHIGFRVLTER